MKHFINKFIIIFLSYPLILIAQTELKPNTEQTGKKFNLENCVNVFDSTKIEKTKVGYQYWFADKDFIDGRTPKMSVVAPHNATH